MARRLTVHLDFGTVRLRVGEIGWLDRQRQSAFEWDAGFAASPLPLSPYLVRRYDGLLLAERAPFDGLPGFVADSLPDGWGRLLQDRVLQRRGVPLGSLTPLDRLALIGTTGMGALSYEPADPDAGSEGEIDLGWFARTAAAVEEDVAVQDLNRMRRALGGSGGARPKFVANFHRATAVLSDHRKPLAPDADPVLVKFRQSQDPASAAEEELAYARMASAAGVEMTMAEVLRAGADSFFLTHRFDRQRADRLHMLTVAGMLGVDYRNPALSYEDLMKLTRMITRDERAVDQMFRRMAFNVLAQNRDDHLKNHAFVMDPAGVWHLSPAYDLTQSAGPGGEHNLTVAGNGRNPGVADLLRAGKTAGVRDKIARAAVEQVTDAVLDWHSHAEASGVPGPRRRAMGEVIAHGSGLQLRV